MKYILNTAIFLVVAITGFGQIMQASIGPGSLPSRIIVYMKPITAVSGTISTLQFDVAINASITPVPTVGIIGATYLNIVWNIDPSYIEDGYRHYQFTTTTSPTVTIGAGAEIAVFELGFTGGPFVPNNVALVTLPGGGIITGNALFLCTGAATSVEGQLYYVRAGTTVVNNNSYTGALPSSSTLGGIILPVKWLSFDVVKQDKNALLNWAVASEDANHHYEVQRSTDGIHFTTIASINKEVNGNHNYKYTDAGIINSGATILYYKIKQVDIDGKMSYSDVRFLRIEKTEQPITIFPNPVTDGFYVSIPFTNPDKGMVTLHLIGANGQSICSKEITKLQAANYYFDLKDKMPAAGNYYLQIMYDEKIIETKKLFINR